MKRATVTNHEYLFAYRLPPAQAWAPGRDRVLSLSDGAPYLMRLGARAVHGLAIAPESEVRAVRVLIDGEWVELVEGAPVRVRPGAVRGEVYVDRLDFTDGALVLEVAEDPCEVPLLARAVATSARLTWDRLLPWPYVPGATAATAGYFLHLQRPRVVAGVHTQLRIWGRNNGPGALGVGWGWLGAHARPREDAMLYAGAGSAAGNTNGPGAGDMAATATTPGSHFMSAPVLAFYYYNGGAGLAVPDGGIELV